MRTRSWVPVAALIVAAACAACDEKKNGGGVADRPAPAESSAATGASTASALGGGAKLPEFNPEQTRLFQPIPEAVENPTLDDATKLGQMLFWDTRLSGNGKVACVTCHDFSKAGADGLVRPTVSGAAGSSGTVSGAAGSSGTVPSGTGSSGTVPSGTAAGLAMRADGGGGWDAGAGADAGPGTAGAPTGPRNTPTVFNCGGSFSQGWDGRASTPEELVTAHTLDPAIMGVGGEKKLVAILSGVPAYAAAFKKAFPDDSPSISAETYGKALGGFTKKLFARGRWDKFLGGDKSAVTPEELSGFAMFVETGCTSCHQGKYIGATQLQKLGMAKPWPPPAGTDPGRFAFSNQAMDRGMWKVPSLRNVTRTGPYLHDGSIATLAEISKLMARYQVGKEITDEQAAAIAKFLGTLEGDPPKVLTEKPALPK